MLNDFYHSFKWVNVGLICGKVKGNAFSLNTNIIINHQGVLEEGNTTYFDNLPTFHSLRFIFWQTTWWEPCCIMEKNYGLKLEDFQARTHVYESHMDIHGIQAKFLDFMGYLTVQGWLTTFVEREKIVYRNA